jgi:hypothetical protein|tara:strand:- start:582 stop:806 length:225 start_codon:yes stop_codon:yes gene_type:complete
MARAIQKIHRHYVEEKAYDLLDLSEMDINIIENALTMQIIHLEEMGRDKETDVYSQRLKAVKSLMNTLEDMKNG